MKKLFYPAIFHAAEEGGYWVTFPDFPECMTQGDSLGEAYEMAMDALGLTVMDAKIQQQELPEPSSPQDTNCPPGASIVLVQFDIDAYNRKHNSKSVRKTLSIPEWLNEEAMALNINFSQTLQDALIQIVSHQR